MEDNIKSEEEILQPSIIIGSISKEYDPEELAEIANVINDNAIVLNQLIKKINAIEQRMGDIKNDN